MRRLAQGALTAITATAAIVALAAAPAFATPITGQSTQPVVAFDLAAGSLLICQESTLAGDDPSPPGPPFVISNASFSNCVTAGSIPVQVTAANLPWVFTAGNPLGQLAGVTLTLDMPILPCTVVISSSGAVSGTYTGSSNILDLDDDGLVVSSSSSTCPTSLFNMGDPVRFKAQYQF